MNLDKILILTLLFSPLLGFLINGFNFRGKSVKISGLIASLSVFVSFTSTVLFFFLTPVKSSFQVLLFEWISVGSFTSSLSFLIDPLSLAMAFVITGVGTLIHIFSIGYMSEDQRPSKYFAYLNFFIFNMLLLVLADNLLLMFVGWEGVGLCSYLLIGFWFTDRHKAQAGLKAFITNRIGDAGFLLGIFILFAHFHTIDFLDLAGNLPDRSEGFFNPITLSALCLFIGAMGKSAQIPLYVWLPDAMAGPTPVSALIHAATMVTAGVYMIIRLSVLFTAAPLVMNLIAFIGILTALLGATLGLTQWDIKKVLAYSTISQLGYMFLALGVGAFSSAFFHLITHAFFKALMFLGAGSVIHSLQGEQDLRKMGSLKKFMPLTSITFTIGWLAIIGIPPFSGFFSKDEILWKTFSQGHYVLWGLGLIASAFTSFYMTRLMTLAFWKPVRSNYKKTPRKSPLSMTIPLILLALLSFIGGFIGLPHIFPSHPPHILSLWLGMKEPQLLITSAQWEMALMVLSVLLSLSFSYLAYVFYRKRPEVPASFTKKIHPLYNFVYHKYKVDEAYKMFLLDPVWRISDSLWRMVDMSFIDKIPYCISKFSLWWSKSIRDLQTGKIERYAVYMIFSLVIVISLALIR